ncbi:MAG: molybdopterin-dependent oxidoreductase [Saccharolobus sp.]|uniref:molybdopterin-dependent oxidoreductase n=1 Tax=Saccharolobus sp. TaxID=2100761 RepID=UPI00316F0003
MNEKISRREFLKITSIGGSLILISTQLPLSETLLKEITTEEAEKLKVKASEVKTYIRNLSLLGSPRLNASTCAVDVKNGRILRIRPLHLDWKYDPKEFNWDLWKVKAANGKEFQPPLKTLPAYYAIAFKQRVYSPARILYPLKRVDFDPEAPPDKRNQEKRGESGFVRITWDEAFNIIEKELRRIRDLYGPAALLCQGDGHGESKTVHARGGIIQFWGRCKGWGGNVILSRNPDSWEGWYWGAKHVWGMDGNMGIMYPKTNTIVDFLENGELALFWGCDPETTPNGHGPAQLASVVCFWLREAGKRVIYVCPDLNFGAAIHADKWIPVLPNTDIALHLAIAYIWITEGTYDKKYIETHTYGFEHFKKYVLGEEDGIPKTPKWAEQICGVPARTIKALARVWAKHRTSTFHSNGGPYIRGPYATEPARTEVYLLAMQGVGKPGVKQIQMHEWGLAGYPLPYSKIVPSTSGLARKTVARTRPIIAKTLYHEAILNPPISWYGDVAAGSPVQNQFEKYQYPEPGYPEVRVIWIETPCWTTCWNGGFKMIDAYRSKKIEFIFCQHQTLENDALFADVLLPVTTTFENDIDIMPDTCSQLGLLFIQYRCIEPLGEAKSDAEICEELAKRFGFLDEFMMGLKSHEEIARKAFETSGVAELISWEELLEKQYVVCPTDPDWRNAKPEPFDWYYNLPEGKGLNTKSGKIEFYAQWLAEYFPDDWERPPVAHFIPYGETHQESLLHPRAKKYPYLMVSNHHRWKEHACHDENAWLREIETFKIKGPEGFHYQVVWIHPIDAAKKGIKHGDIVMIYNERGTTMGAAYVTERIIPGAVSQDHGARINIISFKDRIDRGGANNLICPEKTTSKNAAGMAVSGFLVDIKKVDLAELMAKYPEAFKRKMHPIYDMYLDTYVVG